MPELTRNGVGIDDTFAEAFGMRATAIVITADTPEWARQAAVTMTGFATSVIAGGCEAGIDRDARSPPRRRTRGPASASCSSPCRRARSRPSCTIARSASAC